MPYKALIAACPIAGFMLCGHAMAADIAVSGSEAQQINACTLLTEEEISRQIGFQVDNGSRRDQGFQKNGSYSSTCLWVIQQDEPVTPDPAAPLGGRSFVILNAMQWPAGSDLAGSFLQDFRDAAEHGVIPSAPVPKELGDEALWWGDGLAVRKGDMSFGISVFIPGEGAERPITYEEELAPYILQRLD